MSVRLEDLDLDFMPIARQFIDALDKNGIKYAITETRRSLKSQQDAFRRGASKRDGIKLISLHQAGLAIDVVPLDKSGQPTWDYYAYRVEYKQIASIARLYGLVSGQDWEPKDPRTGIGWDPGHYEIKGE